MIGGWQVTDNTLTKTLTVSQALHRLTNEWGWDENTFYDDNTTKFLENVNGLDRDRVNCAAYPGGPRARRWNSLPNRIRW
jgi:hypothetical protein